MSGNVHHVALQQLAATRGVERE